MTMMMTMMVALGGGWLLAMGGVGSWVARDAHMHARLGEGWVKWAGFGNGLASATWA